MATANRRSGFVHSGNLQGVLAGKAKGPKLLKEIVSGIN